VDSTSPKSAFGGFRSAGGRNGLELAAITVARFFFFLCVFRISSVWHPAVAATPPSVCVKKSLIRFTARLGEDGDPSIIEATGIMLDTFENVLPGTVVFDAALCDCECECEISVRCEGERECFMAIDAISRDCVSAVAGLAFAS
jgi:hypothetical protein